MANGNRPGIYPETKKPQLFPGMEQDLVKEPEGLDWYDTDANALKQIPVEEGLVGIANTPARVILQTFSDESLARLKTAFPRRITNIKRQSIENKELALFFSLNFAKLAPDLYQ